MIKHLSVSLLCLSFLTACSTSYGGKGLLGGIESEWLDGNTLQVDTRTNGLTSAERTLEMTTLWIAEEAVKKDYAYFVVEDFDGVQTFGGGRPGVVVNTKAIMYKDLPTDITGKKFISVEKVISELGPKYIEETN